VTAGSASPDAPAAEPPAAIAWLLTGGEDYGVRRTTLGFMRELKARGVRTIAIVLSARGVTGDLVAAGHEVITFDDSEPPPRFGGNLLGKLVNGLRMLRYRARWTDRVADALTVTGAEVIHVRWPYLVGLAGTAARKAKIRAVWQMPGAVGSTLPFGLNRRYLSRLCRRLDVTPIANSRYTATTLANSRFTPPHAHLGIDPADFDPGRYVAIERPKLGIRDDAIVLAVFARLHPAKGQAQLIEALPDLADIAPALHLMMIGGPYPGAQAHEGELRQLALDLAVADQVHFIGRVAKPQPYYLTADIVVSSTIHAEGFGLSVIEAMMMGRPVLAHALGGPAETVVDGQTGWHVAAATSNDFARGIRRAVDDRERWPQMSRNARDHALGSYSISAAVDRYLGVLARPDGWMSASRA
jgi:glycosyltransferase involved in cell wall biosynthesis